MSRLVACLSLVPLLVPLPVRAFGMDCHESMTTEIYRALRADMPAARAIVPTSNERAFIDDAEFGVPADMNDLAFAALIAGLRDNDLKGRSSNEISDLATVHGNPDFQDEHCLRAEADDGAAGNVAAVEACRAFILLRFAQALDGLDGTGNVDRDLTVDLTIHLSIRGKVDVTLPVFYVRMGQGLHALQDSFPHMFRSADGLHVKTVLNWIDYVNDRLDEPRDGPEHRGALDDCAGGDPLQEVRDRRAREATEGILRIAFDRALSPQDKREQARVLVEQYTGIEPGCAADNDWCDAGELKFENRQLFGCTAGASGAATLVFALLAAVLLVRPRRRFAAAILAVLTLAAFPARAADPVKNADADPKETVVAPVSEDLPAPRVVPVKEPGVKKPSDSAVGFSLKAAGSWDQPAFTGAAGVRWRLNDRWTLGLDGEWNPWIDIDSRDVRRGAMNVYGTFILTYPLPYERFNLRTTAHLGTSTLLMDLYGAPRGSTGFYAGLTPLGIAWKASNLFYLVLEPLGVHLAAPQLKGVALFHREYRVALGMEWMF